MTFFFYFYCISDVKGFICDLETFHRKQHLQILEPLKIALREFRCQLALAGL